jgi:hypothetical protein
VAEDVNPSAYIVNLADCMLVLACGFMVAMIVHWNIDVARVDQLENEQLQEVDPEVMPDDVTSGGSYYVEAGKVYQDPVTGQLYLYRDAETDGDSADGASTDGATGGGVNGTGPGGGTGSSADGTGSPGAGSSGSSGQPGASRAQGAD